MLGVGLAKQPSSWCRNIEMLERLKLENVGSAPKMALDLAPRLNLIYDFGSRARFPRDFRERAVSILKRLHLCNDKRVLRPGWGTHLTLLLAAPLLAACGGGGGGSHMSGPVKYFAPQPPPPATTDQAQAVPRPQQRPPDRPLLQPQCRSAQRRARPLCERADHRH